jgi:hypothetical protein
VDALPGPRFHWGVPTFVFENEAFFGQDRIDLPIRRMQDKGLTRRKSRTQGLERAT